MTRFRLISALLLTPLLACAQPSALEKRVHEAMRRVSAADIIRHATALAHDSLYGRGTGSKGERLAAAYIEQELRNLAIPPAGENGGYLQAIPLHGSVPLSDSRLQLAAGGVMHDFALRKDYLLYKTGAQTFIPQPLRMVFVGYGIVAPEFDYNDYQNIDVAGAIVVYLSGEPLSDDEGFFDGRRPSLHAIPEMKQRVALSRGARGSVMLPLPRESVGYTWSDWVQMFSFEDVTLPVTVPSHLSVLLNPSRAPLLFEGAAWSWRDVLELDASGRMRSFTLDTRMSFAGSFKERDFLAYNVAASIEGSDPLLRDSWVLCTAHYDHLGVGPVLAGDSIYNGMVDNALGVAATLELARLLSRPEFRPRRSILFLFVSGEEKGLLGSQYYCSHPLVPLYKTISVLNIDGIGIIDTFGDIVGIGSEFSTLQQLLRRVAVELGLTVSEIPPAFDHLDAFASSDQIAFAQAGIPAMLVMEGTEYRNLGPEEGFRRFIEWGKERYHTPFDDAEQPVDTAAVGHHTVVLLATLAALADTWEAPQWIRGTKYINARLQSIAEER
ncbi:MAG: M28 family peptidase [Bacteroidia bacterium]|nr:M28 family peptidase [Bacteroidia bacterium]